VLCSDWCFISNPLVSLVMLLSLSLTLSLSLSLFLSFLSIRGIEKPH
jgi:hypothetical protein